MPLYEVEHIFPLSIPQQDALAEAITDVHSKKFSTPRLFVNVNFKATYEARTYIAGKKARANRIFGTVRSSGNARSQADFDSLAQELAQVWADVVHPDAGDGINARQAAEKAQKEGKEVKTEKVDPVHDLRAVFIVGGLISAYEAGFVIPPAGQDVEWAKKNMDAFKKKAAEGDEDFRALVEDLESRKEFGGDPELAAKKQEENGKKNE